MRSTGNETAPRFKKPRLLRSSDGTKDGQTIAHRRHATIEDYRSRMSSLVSQLNIYEKGKATLQSSKKVAWGWYMAKQSKTALLYPCPLEIECWNMGEFTNEAESSSSIKFRIQRHVVFLAKCTSKWMFLPIFWVIAAKRTRSFVAFRKTRYGNFRQVITAILSTMASVVIVKSRDEIHDSGPGMHWSKHDAN